MPDKRVLILGNAPDLAPSFAEAGYAIATELPASAPPAEPFQAAVIAPGWFSEKPFMDSTRADWDGALRENVEAMIEAGQTIARRLIAQGSGGSIIFLSSVAALKPYKGLSTAGVSLAALHVIAQMAAVDLGTYKITVNVIAVGWGAGAQQTQTIDSDAQIKRNIPLERLSTARDVGGLCVFLASDAARYVTGAVIPVDGGYSLTKAGAATPRV